MNLAAAQIQSHSKNIETNLQIHQNLINLAVDHDVDLILFPEMSITGYFREGASEFAFSINDSRLDILRSLSTDHKMIIIVGAPIWIESKIYIGSFILKPDGTSFIYTKQFLHPGEEKFFNASFDYNPIIEFENERISLAICADIDNPRHPEEAGKISTTIYVTSIFFSKQSMNGCHKSLNHYAQEYKMNILMSNYCGSLWGMEAGGKSAFWSDSGVQIAALDEIHPGLLVIKKNDNLWEGYTHKV